MQQPMDRYSQMQEKHLHRVAPKSDQVAFGDASGDPRQGSTLPKGIHAAVVLPLKSDFSIDEAGYQRQLDYVLRHDGMNGLLVNGHASEIHLTGDAEKERVVQLTRGHTGPKISITSGVYAERSDEAAAQARLLESAGADALLVFQPFSWSLGAEAATILTHHRMVHDAVMAPIMLYQAPATLGQLAYAPDVIDQLIEFERVRGVKDGSWEIATSEALEQRISWKRPDVMVFGSGDQHLLVNYFIGTVGSQVSLAAVVPDLVCRLWDAAEAKDWARARNYHDRIQPLANLVYSKAPASRSVARLKACLVILGVIDHAYVRPPMAQLPRDEYRDLEAALARCEVAHA